MNAVPLFLIGGALALLVGLLARVIGLDRDRSFNPTVLMVIASYYLLFSMLAPDSRGMAQEMAVFFVFCAAAVAGFRGHRWLLITALCCHGLFDLAHATLVDNRGVPSWWPAFCLGFDVAFAIWISRVPPIFGRAQTPSRRPLI